MHDVDIMLGVDIPIIRTWILHILFTLPCTCFHVVSTAVTLIILITLVNSTNFLQMLRSLFTVTALVGFGGTHLHASSHASTVLTPSWPFLHQPHIMSFWCRRMDMGFRWGSRGSELAAGVYMAVERLERGICLSMCLPLCLYLCLYICVSVFLSVLLSTLPSGGLFGCLTSWLVSLQWGCLYGFLELWRSVSYIFKHTRTQTQT